MSGTATAQPLRGVRVLITRPAAQAAALAEAVRDAGGEPIVLPAVRIAAIPRAEVAAALDALPNGAPIDLAVFISAHAVQRGAWLVEEGRVRPARVAAIGEATAAALAARGIGVDLVPASGWTSEALLAHPALASQRGSLRSVLIVRGAGGRELLADTFASRGARVTLADVYRRERPAPADEAALERLRGTAGLLVTATSVEIIHNLLSMLGDEAAAVRQAARVIVPSDRVAAAVARAGFRHPPLRSAGAGNEALLETMCAWRGSAGDSTSAPGEDPG